MVIAATVNTDRMYDETIDYSSRASRPRGAGPLVVHDRFFAGAIVTAAWRGPAAQFLGAVTTTRGVDDQRASRRGPARLNPLLPGDQDVTATVPRRTAAPRRSPSRRCAVSPFIVTNSSDTPIGFARQQVRRFDGRLAPPGDHRRRSHPRHHDRVRRPARPVHDQPGDRLAGDMSRTIIDGIRPEGRRAVRRDDRLQRRAFDGPGAGRPARTERDRGPEHRGIRRWDRPDVGGRHDRRHAPRGRQRHRREPAGRRPDRVSANLCSGLIEGNGVGACPTSPMGSHPGLSNTIDGNVIWATRATAS